MDRLTLPVLAVLLAPGLGVAQEKSPPVPPDAIQVRLPSGAVKVSYVEAAEGMMVYVESKGTTVKGRRVHIGDGKVAVMFEARSDGFYTPEGKRNVAALEYAVGDVVKVTKENRRPWGKNSGEVYVLTPGITFQESGEK